MGLNSAWRRVCVYVPYSRPKKVPLLFLMRRAENAAPVKFGLYSLVLAAFWVRVAFASIKPVTCLGFRIPAAGPCLIF